MGLDTGLVERRCPFADRYVRVLSVEEVYLFECTAVRFDTIKASHFDDGRSHSYELVHPRLKLA